MTTCADRRHSVDNGLMATHPGEVRAPAPEISHEELLRRVHDPALTIVDVLPRAAYEEQHVAGALNLPLDEIPALTKALLPDRSREIAVYCGSPT